jgi:Holliday junction resolvase RusA-like endonuclease
MANEVYIEGKFPGMNEIVAASKKHYACYAKMKKENGELFQWATNRIEKFTDPVEITFTWFYKNKRRDPDNIMAAQKFCLDALVANGIIKDDTGEYIASIVHNFVISDKDGVSLRLERF